LEIKTNDSRLLFSSYGLALDILSNVIIQKIKSLLIRIICLSNCLKLSYFLTKVTILEMSYTKWVNFWALSGSPKVC